MTVEDGFPQRLTAIDDMTRGDHWYLRQTDVCRCNGQHTAGKGFDYDATNNLILDFKMPVSRKGRGRRPQKEKAIASAAAALRQALEASLLELDRTVFVPVPPSKAKDDDGYDDRLVRILKAVRPERPLDVRELIVQTRSVEPTHRRPARLRASDIENMYGIGRALEGEEETPSAGVVVVVDDLLTLGAQFRAAQRTLSRRFLDIDVVRLFLARRVAEPVEVGAAAEVGAGRHRHSAQRADGCARHPAILQARRRRRAPARTGDATLRPERQSP